MNVNRNRIPFDDDFDDEPHAGPGGSVRVGLDRRRGPARRGLVVRAIDAALRNPVMAAGTILSGTAIIVIVTNALANQPMRHPSPLFSTRATAMPATGPVAAAASTPARAASPPAPAGTGQATLQPVSAVDTQLGASIVPPVPVSVPVVTAAPAATPVAATPVASAPAAGPAAVPPMSPAPLAIATTQLTERIQQGLHDRGFYTGTVDGIAGPATAEAIRAFEQKIGVAATGEVNDHVLALLKSERGRMANAHPPVAVPSAPPRPTLAALPVAQKPVEQYMPAPLPPEPLTGSAEGRLQRVQKALNTAGYGPLRIDGRLDDRTAAAIRTYEAEHGLPVTGHLTERLMSTLLVRSAAAE